MQGKIIGIYHYRVGGTDGVYLEIDKRKKVLEKMGYKVKLIAGERSKGADYVIPTLEFDRPDIFKIRRNAFEKLEDFKDEQELMDYIHKVADQIKKEFLEIHKKEKFDYLFLHNIFSHGRHIAAAKSFYEVLKKTNIKFIAVDHDFYISYGDMYKSKLPAIQKFLDIYVPPPDKRIKHVTINSIMQKKLKGLWGIDSMLFPDTWDFDQKQWMKDDYNSTFLSDVGAKEEDLIILQATRIVERKAIEIAMDVIEKLQQEKKSLIGKILYNGKKFTKDSDIIFLLSGYVEPASKAYADKLKKLAQQNGIRTLFIEDMISEKRGTGASGSKIYSLWDSYVYADLVSYPSTWEGWGNQFIEAVFAKKPVMIFEYPVFKEDIKKEGYFAISLGDKIDGRRNNGLIKISDGKISKVVKDIIKILTDSKTKDLLEENFGIGDKYHGNKALKKLLKKTLE